MLEKDLEENNLTISDIFQFEIDKAIETGNINYIKQAITKYGNLVSPKDLIVANKIIMQLIEEKIEEINI